MNTGLSSRSALLCDTAPAELVAPAGRAGRRRVSTPGLVLPVAGGVAGCTAPARLMDAAAAACDVAVITTQPPGSRFQQNAQRRGFDQLYTRAVLVRHSREHE